MQGCPVVRLLLLLLLLLASSPTSHGMCYSQALQGGREPGDAAAPLAWNCALQCCCGSRGSVIGAKRLSAAQQAAAP